MDVRKRLIEMADGSLVEEDALRIAQKIAEYDDNLRLKYCAREADLTDAPYKLVEICKDGAERIVFDVWELDDRVIERLYAADTRHRDIEAILNKENAEAKRDENRRYQEKQDEALEIAQSVYKSSKDTYKMTDPHTGKKMKIHSHRPVEVEE